MKFINNPEAIAYKQMRQSVQMTSTDMARALGVTRETISRREAGTVTITQEAWFAIGYVCEEAHGIFMSWMNSEIRKNETLDDEPEQVPKAETRIVQTQGKLSTLRGDRTTKPKRKKRR